MIYNFDTFELNTESFELLKQGNKIVLEPRVFDTLVYLVENHTKVVSKDELVENLWAGRIISDATLNTCIRSVRRALGDDAKQHKYIRTFPKRGFQFVGKISPNVSSLTKKNPQPQKTYPNKLVWGSITIFFVIGTLAVLNFLQSDSPDSVKIVDERTSIAVLNFKGAGADSQQHYYTEGLMEELVSNLSLYQELFIIARNSSSLYDNSELSIGKIGDELGVEYIVDGSVRYRDENMVVSAKLVDTKTAQQVWSTTFDHKQSELWGTPKELAYRIVGQIVPAVTRADVYQNRKRSTDELDAWALYHKARSMQAVFTEEMQKKAILFAQTALDKDITLASAYGVIARAKGTQFFYQWTEDSEHTLAEAIANAETALSLDSNDSGAYAALGYVYRYTGDEVQSIANLERATTLNPSDANIKLEYAHTLDWFRHQKRALPEINKAIKLSPRDPRLQNMYFYKAHIQFHLFDHLGSLATTKMMSGVLTNDTWRMYYHLMRAANLAQLGKSLKANENIKKALTINPDISLGAMRKKFKDSQNHPENRRFWLESLAKAGLPE